MIEIALLRPEIPPNTGNIIRLCANMGSRLHIIGPVKFSLDNKQARRAGLDYQDLVCVQQHASFEHFMVMLNTRQTACSRIFICTSQGSRLYTDVHYQAGDILMFGPETVKFPEDVLRDIPQQRHLRIPMQEQSRCLNLSNAVAVIAYEAWRQNNFIGGQ